MHSFGITIYVDNVMCMLSPTLSEFQQNLCQLSRYILNDIAQDSICMRFTEIVPFHMVFVQQIYFRACIDCNCNKNWYWNNTEAIYFQL